MNTIKPNFLFSFILFAVLLAAFALPAFAQTYTPGVKVGQFVKYGNFVGVGPGFEVFNNYDWLKLQVTNVSGSEVTLLSTGQFKNGTAVPGNGSTQVWDVAAGTENGEQSTQGAIIATNLKEGDAIPPLGTYTVNETENAVYLGVTRIVNVLNVTVSTSGYNATLSYVYDQASGMLLEANSQTTTQTQPQPLMSTYSYSIIETNIFGLTSGPSPSPSPTVPEFPSQLLGFATVAFFVISVSVVVGKRKKIRGNQKHLSAGPLGCATLEENLT